MVSEPTCWARCCRVAGCLSGVKTFLLGTVGQGCRLFKPCWNLLPCTVGQGCRLFKRCWNIPTKHFIAGVQAVEEVSKPTCQDMRCSGVGCLSGIGTYLPGTVLQGSGCLSSVGTYMLGTLLQVCRLLKQRQNLSPEHCGVGVKAA